MGGAGKPYHPLCRDWGCSAIAVVISGSMTHWQINFWWVYLLIFLAHWGAFSTYFQFFFGGKDTLWFSGAMVGLALYPLVFISANLFPFIALRAVLLALVWGCLNKFLPQKGILVWRRDVVEEFCRYFVSL